MNELSFKTSKTSKLDGLALKKLAPETLGEVKGGFLLSLAAGYAVGALFVAMENPEGVLDGFVDAFN